MKARGQEGYVTYAFAGTIDESTAPAIHVGDPFSGRFTYSRFQIDRSPLDPTRGVYEEIGLVSGGVVGMDVTVGPYFTRAHVVSTWWVVNSEADSFLFTAWGGSLIRRSLGASIFLEDPTGVVFTSDQIPDALELSSFAVRRFTGRSYSGEITSLRRVPEPTSFALAISALVVLVTRAVTRRTFD